MLRLAENYGKNYYLQLMQNANCKPKWRSPAVIILKYISECCLATVSKEIGFPKKLVYRMPKNVFLHSHIHFTSLPLTFER